MFLDIWTVSYKINDSKGRYAHTRFNLDGNLSYAQVEAWSIAAFPFIQALTNGGVESVFVSRGVDVFGSIPEDDTDIEYKASFLFDLNEPFKHMHNSIPCFIPDKIMSNNQRVNGDDADVIAYKLLFTAGIDISGTNVKAISTEGIEVLTLRSAGLDIGKKR